MIKIIKGLRIKNINNKPISTCSYLVFHCFNNNICYIQCYMWTCATPPIMHTSIQANKLPQHVWQDSSIEDNYCNDIDVFPKNIALKWKSVVYTLFTIRLFVMHFTLYTVEVETLKMIPSCSYMRHVCLPIFFSFKKVMSCFVIFHSI